MLKIHLTFQLDILFGASQSQKVKTKKIKLPQGRSYLKKKIIHKKPEYLHPGYVHPEYVHKVRSLYYLERQFF